MNFLADESCDFTIVKTLREKNFDVMSISEKFSGSDDTFVIDLAIREKRILLTEDKDFGRLVYAKGKSKSTVIFFRYPHSIRNQIIKDFLNFLKKMRDKIPGHFIVVQPGRIRMTQMPEN